MKKIFLLICLLIFCSGCCAEKQSKYEIKNANGLNLLIDKTNGLVWRNVWCDNNEKIPNCWTLMEYRGAIVPDGEQKRRNDTPFEDLLK